jgi:MFS transporter, CP family, cyanate transporter
MISSAITIPYVLPALGGSWRADMVFWAVPALLIVPVFYLLSPHGKDAQTASIATGGRWWPDWNKPLIWLLGLTLGSNNSAFFGTNAFIGDYLASQGKSQLFGLAVGWLNGMQVAAPFLLLAMADRLERRAWPFLVFGPILLASFVTFMLVQSNLALLIAAGLVGFTTAMTFAPALALPAMLSAPGDVSRTSAGTFTVSYTCGIAVPTISGMLWDLTGRPWTAFLPLCVCAVTLTVLGPIVARHPAQTEKPAGR